ncbi:peptide-methionine (S)-S-oxide reductase MsrA [Arenimonas alkanexedens]
MNNSADAFGKFAFAAKLALSCVMMLGAATACARSAPEAPAPGQAPSPAASTKTATAIFAGGCFWCMEPPYDKLEGVISTTSGYTSGRTVNPSYQQVSSGGTGHTEAVQIVYDPSKVSYAKLLEVFWRNIDPTVANRQFCDVGDMYRSGIYPADDQQRQSAEASKQALQASGRFPGGIATEIEPASTFYPAEEYHQDYYLKNPLRYKFYRLNCGRDQRLEALWGKPGA